MWFRNLVYEKCGVGQNGNGMVKGETRFAKNVSVCNGNINIIEMYLD
jgi:hypothetical protein